MLYVVFSFVFIKYVNDRFWLSKEDHSSYLRLISLPRSLSSSQLGALAVAPWGLSSFAVAKVRRKSNTNQISRRKSRSEWALSAIHYPLEQRITEAKSFFSFKEN